MESEKQPRNEDVVEVIKGFVEGVNGFNVILGGYGARIAKGETAMAQLIEGNHSFHGGFAKRLANVEIAVAQLVEVNHEMRAVAGRVKELEGLVTMLTESNKVLHEAFQKHLQVELKIGKPLAPSIWARIWRLMTGRS
jgi:hypothetical protein